MSGLRVAPGPGGGRAGYQSGPRPRAAAAAVAAVPTHGWVPIVVTLAGGVSAAGMSAPGAAATACRRRLAPYVNVWGASSRNDRSTPASGGRVRWAAWSCLRRVSLMRVIPVVVLMAAEEGYGRGRWRREHPMVVAYRRRRGPPHQLLGRRCAHLLAPRALSPAHATHPRSPRSSASQIRQPRGQRSPSSGYSPQRPGLTQAQADLRSHSRLLASPLVPRRAQRVGSQTEARRSPLFGRTAVTCARPLDRSAALPLTCANVSKPADQPDRPIGRRADPFSPAYSYRQPLPLCVHSLPWSRLPLLSPVACELD